MKNYKRFRQQEKQEKMVYLNSIISIITFNMNSLTTPI